MQRIIFPNRILNVACILQGQLLSLDFGKHLLEVEDLLQKHLLVEADIAVQAERVRSANAAALKFANGDSEYSFIPHPSLSDH